MTDQPLPAGRFAAGQSLDRYQIVAPLGTGGMGEVYRARDVRLAREVAVKVLPASLASDPERLRRFEREARATGSLDHPNVLVVHDVGTQDETSYLVTELLEGETLRERMEAGPVPASRALEIGAGVARGLSAAHQKGIVHRDLKPDNVFLTRDGRVKILDFGLAKITGPLGVDPDAQTLAAADRGTMPGLLLGTAGYMSPEQVRGGEADPRSDVFALGVILYELLWDRRAFAEASKVETLSAILRTDPLEAPTPPTVSPSLLDIVRRCLEKDPEERFQSARDLAFALEALGAAEESGSTRSVMTVRRRPGGPPSRLARTGRALVLAGLSALAALFGERILVPGPLPRIVGFRALVGGLPRSPETWTTDGERVYYTIDREGRHEVYQVPLRGGEPSRLETPFEQARVLDASARRSAILVLGWDGGLTAWQSRDQTLWILPVPAGAARNTGLEGLAASTVAWGNLRGDGAAVWTADLATKRVAMLPGSAGMMGAKCARDGKVLAARSWTEGYWLYRPETGRWTDLGSPSNLWYPTFARDGSTVYGLSRDDRAIYRFRLDDPRRVKVAELGTIEPTAPWQEVWMGLDPDDAPLILRNTGFSDLFVLDWASR